MHKNNDALVAAKLATFARNPFAFVESVDECGAPIQSADAPEISENV